MARADDQLVTRALKGVLHPALVCPFFLIFRFRRGFFSMLSLKVLEFKKIYPAGNVARPACHAGNHGRK